MAKKSTGADAAGDASTRNAYDEWECKITNTEDGPVEEKLKKIRSNVKISDEQAEILNTGVLKGGNTYGRMYFPAE